MLQQSATNDPSNPANLYSIRVQYQTLQSIGQFASLFPDAIPELINMCLPTMMAMLTGSTNVCDRIQGHSANAMINLMAPDHCPVDSLTPYLNELLSSLVCVLQSTTLPAAVQAPCLVVLG